MKKLALALGLAVPSIGFAAKSLPTVPQDCLDDVQLKGYCTDYEAPIFKGPVNIKFFVVADKSVFPTVEAAIARYTDFAAWPQYVVNSGKTNVEFVTSVNMEPIPAKDGNGEVLRHYANYRLKAPVVGWQDVRVLTHNNIVEPYEGALASLELTVQSQGTQEVPAGEKALEGSEGVKNQIGSVHAIDCAKSNLCTEDQHLLVYESTITPDIDILPSVAAGAIQEGIEAIIIGMFSNVDGDDGEVL